MKNNYLSKSKIIITLSVALVLLVVGTFYDYQISTALVDTNNLFGKIFAGYGMFPYAMMLCFISLSCIKLIKKYNKYLMIIGFIFFQIFAYYIIHHDSFNLFDNMGVFLYIIDLAVTVLLDIAMFPIVDKCDSKKLLKYCAFLCVFGLIAVGVNQGLKILWGRPRMVFLLENPDCKFQNWYEISREAKKLYVAQGVDSDMFKSFPSGHIQCGSAILFLSSLGLVNKNFRSKLVSNLLYAFAIIYIVVLAYTRIRIGAHFLSDVSMSFILTFGIYAATYYFFGYNKTKNKNEA